MILNHKNDSANSNSRTIGVGDNIIEQESSTKLLGMTIEDSQHYGCQIIVHYIAHRHYTLVGSPTWGSILNPLVALTSTTVYTYIDSLHFALSIIIYLEKTPHIPVSESIGKFDHAMMIIACS